MSDTKVRVEKVSTPYGGRIGDILTLDEERALELVEGGFASFIPTGVPAPAPTAFVVTPPVDPSDFEDLPEEVESEVE